MSKTNVVPFPPRKGANDKKKICLENLLAKNSWEMLQDLREFEEGKRIVLAAMDTPKDILAEIRKIRGF